MVNITKTKPFEYNVNRETSGKDNYNAIDLAKFICAVLVVIIHVPIWRSYGGAGVYYHVDFLLRQAICRIAVPLFFVFSGFFLYRKTALNNFSMNPTKKYVMHILFLYIEWSIIYFPLYLIMSPISSTGLLHGLSIYIRDFFLIGSYTHLWYLPALIFAVLLISLLLHLKCNPNKILLISFIFYVFGLLGDAYFGAISHLLEHEFLGKSSELYFSIFGTTRNGLFFAFFFVSVGMAFSNAKKTLSTKKALLFFLISLFMLCTESFLLKIFSIAADYNILIFAIPAACFGFAFLESLNLKDNKIYKNLRKLSSLIFYGHLWVDFGVSSFLSLTAKNLQGTPVHFLGVLFLTITIALIVIKISQKKSFHWLKKLY